MNTEERQTEPRSAAEFQIDRLVLKNYRCFANAELALHPKLTVLVGKNAAGKTAILEALATVIREWTNGIIAPEERWNRLSFGCDPF